MYKVEKFEVRDEAILSSVMEQYPFATVISVFNGNPFINHLPITTEKQPDGKIKLLGHMSRRNPQWEQMKNGSPVVIVFNGPHAYINPSWYAENDVPTWNYIAVHASGIASMVEDYAGMVRILKKTTDHMNRINQDKWEFFMPLDLEGERDLTNAIIGFEIIPRELLGKFKLNQNRKSEDRLGVVKGLNGRRDEGSLQVANWMSKLSD